MIHFEFGEAAQGAACHVTPGAEYRQRIFVNEASVLRRVSFCQAVVAECETGH